MIKLSTPIFLYTIVIFIDLFVALVAWQRRRFPGGFMLFFLMLAAAEWTCFAGFEMYETLYRLKILFSQISNLGALACPVLFLLFALSITSEPDQLNRRRIALLFVIPLITLILTFTTQHHQLIWNRFSAFNGVWGTIQHGYGPAYWIGQVGYSYICLFTGSVIISHNTIKKKTAFRWQANILMVATLVPWIGSLVQFTRLNPFTGVDVNPVTFSITGIFIGIYIFLYRFRDINPIARGVLFEKMVDGLIMLDPKDRIIDINPAGLQLVGTSYRNCIGRSAADLLGPQFFQVLKQDRHSTKLTEISWGKTGEQILEVTTIPIIRKNGKIDGYLLVNKDITVQRIIENKLQDANNSLREQLNQINILQDKLREEAIHDPLSGLYNRRFLDHILLPQINQAKRNNMPLSLVMLDLDKFKNFNDTWGHSAGDALIQNLSKILIEKTRHGDFAFRYGGEEFLVVMPGASLNAAMKRAEEWRQEFQNTPIVYEGKILGGTFSAGVAAYPVHAITQEGLIRAADKSLYLAKNSGRNRVAFMDSPADVIHLLSANNI